MVFWCVVSTVWDCTEFCMFHRFCENLLAAKWHTFGLTQLLKNWIQKKQKKRESLKIKNKNLWDLWTPLKSTLLQHTLHFFSRILFIHAEKPFFFLIPHAKFLWSICFFLVICMFHLRLVECIFVYFMFNLLSTRDLCLHTLCTPAAHLTDMNWKFLYK